jgi:hypothetical protein
MSNHISTNEAKALVAAAMRSNFQRARSLPAKLRAVLAELPEPQRTRIERQLIADIETAIRDTQRQLRSIPDVARLLSDDSGENGRTS